MGFCCSGLCALDIADIQPQIIFFVDSGGMVQLSAAFLEPTVSFVQGHLLVVSPEILGYLVIGSSLRLVFLLAVDIFDVESRDSSDLFGQFGGS